MQKTQNKPNPAALLQQYIWSPHTTVMFLFIRMLVTSESDCADEEVGAY